MFRAIRRKVWGGVAAAMAFALCSTAFAQPLGFAQTLPAPEGQPEFSIVGGVIAADGDLALIGGRSPVGSTNYNWVVDAYQFIDGTWVHIQTIESPDRIGTSDYNIFGHAIKMDNGIAVIGDQFAPRGEQFDGAAYVYRWDGMQWIYEQKLISSKPSGGDGYAQWVGVSGQTIVVSAPSYESGSGPVFQGLVFVYELGRSGAWEEIQIIEEPDITGLWAGQELVFENDTLVFGSHTNGYWAFQTHVLTRDESGLFAFDLSFPVEFNGKPLDAVQFSINDDEVLLFRRTDGLGFSQQLMLAGFTKSESAEWTLSTLVLDPLPGEFIPNVQHGAITGSRSGDRIFMTTSGYGVFGGNGNPLSRVLSFQRDADGIWQLQPIAPPPGTNQANWNPYSFVPASGGWLLSGDLTQGGIVYYTPITPQPCPGDLNNDAIVDADDLGILLGAFGSSCP